MALMFNNKMPESKQIRVGMCGLGMIFSETYGPLFRQLKSRPLFRRDTGPVEIRLAGIASRTGQRAPEIQNKFESCPSYSGTDAVGKMLADAAVDVICVATPDDRHFEPARAAIKAGKHVLIEKPSVLSLQQLDELVALANETGVLAKVVYHKLFDPDHKRLRTLYHDGVLRHVNNGYCSLLEPKAVSRSFAEWIGGRNPATYVAVHYLKLIDFTFGPDWRLTRIQATGQRGQINPSTWDSVQLWVSYVYSDGREAAFDIHTDWVTPDNFPGAVEQEVQFRFDNGVWNAHQRKRGVECVIEGLPVRLTPNHHYSTTFLEPWNDRSQRGYGLEAIERFFEEVASVEFGGPPTERDSRLQRTRDLPYNDLAADRNVVAAVQGCEAILRELAEGRPGAMVELTAKGQLQLTSGARSQVLYAGPPA